ncbi:hypothetical protein [Sodalis sp. dw_96]|uniref:hypothetical protein n=1 Tax=Sodalis sp. dw_96 TaxID=2719794 RepID=UPI001BD2505E|nr:hypothetical protein [Sodalis sp. dw_96]
MAKIDIHTDAVFTAGNYLTDINLHYPSDITKVSSLFANCILQADFDSATPTSLTRNRVSATPMTVVGAPALGTQGATFSETAYIDTGLNISAYNGVDLTFVAIAMNPGGIFNLVGRLQTAAPQQSRSLLWSAATIATCRWNSSAGTSTGGNITPSTPTGQAEFLVGRTANNNGSNVIQATIDVPRTGGEAAQTGTAAAYAMPSSEILIGASVGATTTVTCFIRAVLVFNRVLADSEITALYRLYQNYYYFDGIAI